MDKEIDKQKDEEDDIDIDENDETEDSSYWKELALKKQGMLKREKTKHEKIRKDFDEYKGQNPKKEEKIEKPPEKPEKPNEFDYGQRAFLKTYGISGSDELALAKGWVERTGDTIDVLVEDEIFNAKLKSLRDQKAAKEAVPTSGRSAPTYSKSKAEYWDDKPFDEVPPELKQESLNRRIEKDKEGGKFTSNPVIMGGQ